MTSKMNATRRETLALLGAAATLPFLSGSANAEQLETLALYGPPAGPSITLANAVNTGMFKDLAKGATFSAWRNPDELRAGLTSGTIQLSVVPVQAAANLYNRGFPIRLANIMTEGLLYVITADPAINSISALKGRKIAVAFAGDTPDIILDQLLNHAGLDPQSDLVKQPAGTPVEAMQLLLAGRIDAALVGEPAASAAVVRGAKAGKTIVRGIDIQSAWADMTGGPAVLPQAGLAVTQAFLDDHSAILPPVLEILQQSATDVVANPRAAAAHAVEPLGLPLPVIVESIPHSKLVARPAQEARPEIEAMLKAMAGDGMKRIGGAMPDDAFYL